MRVCECERDELGLHPVASERIRLWGGLFLISVCVPVVKQKVVSGKLCE